MNQEEKYIPSIGDIAPSFKADTTMGPIDFPNDKKGKWVILFSHPADFTPVCTSEFLGFQDLFEEFKKNNIELLGYSVDGVHSHIEWIKNIKNNFGVEIKFPIIAGMDVAHKYNLLHKINHNVAVRAVFIITPEGEIAAINYYPLSNGRNIKEILRLTNAIQKTYNDEVATPESWPENVRFEDDVIVPPAKTIEDAEKNQNNTDYKCYDWYICTKKDK